MALDQREERAKILKYLKENKDTWQGLQKKDIVSDVMKYFNMGSAKLASKVVDEAAPELGLDYGENTYTPSNGNDLKKEREIAALESIAVELKMWNETGNILLDYFMNKEKQPEPITPEPDEKEEEKTKAKK